MEKKQEQNPYRFMCVYAGPAQMAEASRRLDEMAAKWDREHSDAAKTDDPKPDAPKTDDPTGQQDQQDQQERTEPEADPAGKAKPIPPKPDASMRFVYAAPAIDADNAVNIGSARDPSAEEEYPLNHAAQKQPPIPWQKMATVYAGPPIPPNPVVSERLSEMITRAEGGEAAFCDSCGTKFRPGARFCTECGSARKKVRICPACGEKIMTDPRYCPYCGAKMK